MSAVPPVYFRVDHDALYDHYRLIAAAAAGTPIYPYHIPSATGVEISAEVMSRLVEIPAVRGLKYSSYNRYDMRNIIELESVARNLGLRRDELEMLRRAGLLTYDTPDAVTGNH